MLRLQSTPHGARLAQLHQNLPFLRKIVSLGDVPQDPPRRLPFAPPEQSICRAEKLGQRPHESDGSVTSSDLSPIISKRIPPRTDFAFPESRSSCAKWRLP